MNIGGRLRKIRTEQNLTVKALSQLSNVPEKTIYRIETGEVTDPKLSSIGPLMSALNCSTDELVFDAETVPKMGRLKQLIARAEELEPAELDLIITVLRKLILAMRFEKRVAQELMEESFEDDEEHAQAEIAAERAYRQPWRKKANR